MKNQVNMKTEINMFLLRIEHFLSDKMVYFFVGHPVRSTQLEDNIRWKTTFGGRQPLLEDNLWWKKTFGGRQSSVENDFP